MNITLRRALSVCVLAGSLALALALAAGAGSAEAKSSVVGPGESIQKAIYAADPGDTIVVKGVHREDVIIRKNGLKLVGQDAVIEAPARADSRCSKVFGSTGLCVLGDIDLQSGQVRGYVKNVSISGFTVRGFEAVGIDVEAARDATVTKVRAVGNKNGMGTALSIGTRFLSNAVRRTGEDAIGLEQSRDVTIANNDVEGSSNSAIFVEKGTDATIEGNDLTDNTFGMLILESTGTRIVSNDVSHSDILGIYLQGPKRANNNAKIVGNHISGGPWGIYVQGAHGGSVVGNDVRDNCAGIWFEAFKDEPVGGFDVKGNTLADNTRSCGGQKFGRKFSGIGIALLGASGMEVAANHFWGNVPSGPTPVSGGVVVSKDPYFQDTNFGGKQKPTNNTVVANHFGRNKPDIFWDESGSGNRFVANRCDTSVPSSLCK